MVSEGLSRLLTAFFLQEKLHNKACFFAQMNQSKFNELF
jgi:hypothetical protein